ncbi:MAG TPA: hypothetical protein VFY25_06880 [Anaerolineales bacterium]|nr:hypothetical protein [Anaerolineales bacterium]
MKFNRSGLFWGLLLIGAGAVALGQQLGYIDQFTDPRFWIWVFGLIGLVAVIEYALSGWKQWGWLFPAGVFGGLAITILLATNNVGTAAVATPLFIGLTIPFAAAYLSDRVRNWWALIPGGVMVFLALVTLLVDSAGGEWVGALFLFMIAGIFLTVYLSNRTRTWALLVAYITGVLGIAPLMSTGGRDAAYFGAIFLFAIGLPFFVVYFRSAQNWWAIIPAGTMTVLAIITALAIAGLINEDGRGGFISAGLVNALLMGGLAATFAVVWLRHEKPWAKVVAIVLAAVGVASIFFASYSQLFWPVAIILVGVYLFFIGLRPRAV